MKFLRSFYLFVFLFSLGWTAHAQNISGVVYDAGNKKPISNVSIQLGNTHQGASTSLLGGFTLSFSQKNITQKDSLYFSHIGYQTLALPMEKWENTGTQNIYLKPKTYELQEVFVNDPKAKFKTFGYNNKRFITILESPALTKMPKKSTQKGREQLSIFNVADNMKVQSLSFYFATMKKQVTDVQYQLNFYSVKEGLPYQKIVDKDIHFWVHKDTSKIFWGIDKIDLRPYKIHLKGYQKIAIGLAIINQKYAENDTTQSSFYISYSPSLSKNSFYRMSDTAAWQKQSNVQLCANIEAQVLKNGKYIVEKEDTLNVDKYKSVLKLMGLSDEYSYLKVAQSMEEAQKSIYGKHDGQYIPVSEGRIYYETYGKGEPLVLLHGNKGSISHFYKQIPDFAQKYQVIAIDTRGQGKSEDSSTQDYSYELFADDLKTVLDSLHISKTHILGWSDGGNTALIMAYRHPEYVKSIITSGAVMNPTGVQVTVLERLKREYKESLKNEGNSSTDISSLRLQKLIVAEPHIQAQNLQEIHCPALIMAGKNDVVLLAHTQEIAHDIPKAQLAIIKGATHYPAWEQTKIFNNKVIAFLKTIK